MARPAQEREHFNARLPARLLYGKLFTLPYINNHGVYESSQVREAIFPTLCKSAAHY